MVPPAIVSHDTISGLQVLLVDDGLNIVAGIAILVIGWTLGRWASKAARRGLGHLPQIDETLKPLIASAVRYAILFITLVAVLERFGVQTTSFIAVLGATGLAIGLALQGTLSNVAAGVMLLLLRPFKVGDVIDVAGKSGTVKEIGLFITELRAGDNLYVSIPNSSVFSSAIVNYTREQTRQIDIKLALDHSANVDKAQKIVRDILLADERVLKEPAPSVPLTALDETSMTLNARCFVSIQDFDAVKADTLKLIKLRFDAAPIPFPQQYIAVTPRRLTQAQ